MVELAATDFIIGVDIGGTKVAAGLVSPGGEISGQVRVPMVVTGTAAEGLNAVASAIDSVCSESGMEASRGAIAQGMSRGAIRGIGICSPGPLDPTKGVIINPPNVPCWRNFPLASEVAKLYEVPVRIDNDANAAALAESRWGAGRGYSNVFYATMGTGIGTGIVFDGKIYHGRTGAAAEGGHLSINYLGPRCGCGKAGCIEAYASGPAIARRTREKLTSGKYDNSTILELSGGNLEVVSSEVVNQAYAKGDVLSREIMRETVELLAAWLGNVVDLLEPDVIIIGGGMAEMMKPLFGEIRKQLPNWSINSRAQEIPIVMAHYGAEAGIAGGAALCSDILG